MGWHDDLAVRAIATGKTAVEFKNGAQRKANATWIYLIIAAGVWYFIGWLWALIPAALAALSAFQSMSATLIAARLEKTEVSRPLS